MNGDIGGTERILDSGQSWNGKIGMNDQAENGMCESHWGQQSNCFGQRALWRSSPWYLLVLHFAELLDFQQQIKSFLILGLWSQILAIRVSVVRAFLPHLFGLELLVAA